MADNLQLVEAGPKRHVPELDRTRLFPVGDYPIDIEFAGALPERWGGAEEDPFYEEEWTARKSYIHEIEAQIAMSIALTPPSDSDILAGSPLESIIDYSGEDHDTEEHRKFTLFPKLPIELRLQIWNLVHLNASPRIVQFKPGGGKAPALIHACKESRQKFRPRYELCISVATRQWYEKMPDFGIFIDWNVDIVHLSPLTDIYKGRKLHDGMEHMGGRYLRSAMLRLYHDYVHWARKMKRVAIDLEENNKQIRRAVRSISWFEPLGDLDKVEEVFVVMDSIYDLQYDGLQPALPAESINEQEHIDCFRGFVEWNEERGPIFSFVRNIPNGGSILRKVTERGRGTIPF